jgi:hypothetical protein
MSEPNGITRQFCWMAAMIAFASALPVSSRAFLRWDEGRNLVFANVTAGVLFDSNITTSAGGDSDLIYSTLLALDYERRAGIIGVNGSLGYAIAHFGDNSDEDYQNPRARVELTKRTGRTTGSLSMAAQRESRAEPVVNFRTDSWNYDTDFRFKYPVIDRYSIAGGLNYNRRDYTNNPLLVDLTTVGATTDLFYAYSSQRDLLGGYRLRISETSAGSRYRDHAFTVGVSGRILPKLNGSFRVGYQLREGSGEGAESDQSFTTGGSATWNISKRSSVTVQVMKDYSTTSTDLSIDSFGATLEAQHSFTGPLMVGGGLGAGTNRFLGGRGAGREDVYASAHLLTTYTFSERLKLNLTYQLYQNWSTLAVSDFDRHSISLAVSSRF